MRKVDRCYMYFYIESHTCGERLSRTCAKHVGMLMYLSVSLCVYKRRYVYLLTTRVRI